MTDLLKETRISLNSLVELKDITKIHVTQINVF